MDVFEVSSSNFSLNYIVSLLYGHRTGGKTADEVLYMLNHVLQLHRMHASTNLLRSLQVYLTTSEGK